MESLDFAGADRMRQRSEGDGVRQPMPANDASPSCRHESVQSDVVSKVQVHHDLWIQCDDCDKWRELSVSQFAQVQNCEQDARWACPMLFEGASCQLADDWKLQQRHVERQLAAQQQKEATQAQQEARVAMLASRALRAKQRANGLSAVQRHLPSTSVQGDEGDSSEAEPSSTVSRRKRKSRAALAEELCEDRDHWEECTGCQQWVNLGKGRQSIKGVCHQCGAPVIWQGHHELQSWVQCDACGRWRTVPDSTLRGIEAEGEGGQWRCEQMQGSVTCRSSAGDWGAALRRRASHLRHHGQPAPHPLQLSIRIIEVGDRQAERVQWAAHAVTPSSHFLEYIPGRDQLWTPEALRAGLDVHDAGSEEHVLWACALPEAALSAAKPFICRGMQLFEAGKLPVCTDGRLSAGPLDLPAFLAQASVSESVRQAVHKQTAAVQAAAQASPPQLPPAAASPAQLWQQQTGSCAGQQAGPAPPLASCSSLDPTDQPLVTARMSSSAARPLLASASEPRGPPPLTADLPLQVGPHQQVVEAEGPTGNPSQAADRQQELVEPELHTPDASVSMEAAETEVVPSLSLQQSGEKRSRAKTPGDARPQLWQVVHVSPDMRKAYIGSSSDLTAKGKSIMAFNKSWRSLPIQSWSGGLKIADMPGRQPNKLVASKLSSLLQDQEAGLVQAAELVWQVFAAGPSTAAAALRMRHNLMSSPLGSGSCLGNTAWNAYSLNIDYRTGCHLDGKNTPGSYSALIVFETQEAFVGSHYMLPQYRMGLDVRQGCVVFHRSGDAGIGLHGNSGLWRPSDTSHRVALVLYQTELKTKADTPLTSTRV